MVAGNCKGGWDGGLIADLWLQGVAGPSYKEFWLSAGKLHKMGHLSLLFVMKCS